jgi:RNA polymerase sigma-70 factor (ECF subfamily)
MSMTSGSSVESLLAHRAWVRALSRAIVADPGTADDVEQATWLTALRRPPTDGGSVRAWFASVVKSRALDAAREGRRRAAREELSARRGVEPSAADVAARFDAERRVAQAVHALPDPLRTTVLLRFHEDLSVRETARRMGVPYETARARLRVALARLRADLRGRDGRGLACVALLGGGWKGVVMASTKQTATIAAACLAVGFAAGVFWARPAAMIADETADVATKDAPRPPRAGPARFAVRDRRDDAPSETERASGAVAATDPSATPTAADNASAAADAAAADGVFRLPKLLRGHVVDDATGEPLGEARILVFMIRAVGSTGGGHGGDRSEADGAFSVGRPSGWDEAGAHAELRLAKDGYETAKVAVIADAPVVRMRKQERPPTPSRVTGVMLDKDEKPLSGLLIVAGTDEIRNNAAQFVVADSAGEFVLEGVPPGHWSLSVMHGPRVEAVVPEGGVVRVQIHAGPDARTDEERAFGENPSQEGYGDPRFPRDAAGKLVPAREVVVTGLPTTPGTVVRASYATTVPRIFWRFEAKDGEARFPALAPGSWKLVVVHPGQISQAMSLDVPAGDGPLRIEFKPM